MSEPQDEHSVDSQAPGESEGGEAASGVTDSALEAVVHKVSVEHGFDVRGYKRTTLYRRIRKRMQDAKCGTLEDYLVILETDAHEYAQLVDTILINVTEFFRDRAAWDYLQREALSALVRQKGRREPVRAWSVGCATGEEAYTLAICFAELFAGTDNNVKIYGTDMDEGALAVARAGIYDAADLRNVSAERRARFFEELPGGRCKVRREIRSMVIFGQHNVLAHAPISRLDVLVCRNLLIYFDSETQQQLLKRFHYALQPGGYLFLGKAETLMSRSSLFRTVEPRFRDFQRALPTMGMPRVSPLSSGGDGKSDLQGETGMEGELALMLSQAGTPVLIVQSDGTLINASPSARELFGISDGHLGRPLAQLEDRSRLAPLRLALDDVRATGREARVEQLQLVRPDGRTAFLEVIVKPRADAEGRLLCMILWVRDMTREFELSSELGEVRQELETTSEELQTANEELETTNEELQSTNEELETTNEELQSTNEELETTIEELQSTNEELETANDELRSQQEELHERERFQSMILSSLDLGVIVVRGNWEVRSWNKLCEELWGLRQEEVVGQNLFSLDTGMPFEVLREPLKALCRGESGTRMVELEAMNRRGKPVRCRVRLQPLIQPEDGVAGAMLLIELTAQRNAPPNAPNP